MQQLNAGQKKLVIITAAMLALAAAAWLVLRLAAFEGDTDFRNNLWAPSYLLLHGQSPYRVDVLYAGKLALWLPPAIGLFFPLGWLDLHTAANLWFVGNIALMLLLLWWMQRSEGVPLPPLLTTLVALLPPVLFHLFLEQYTLLAVLLMLLATHMLVEGRFVWAGLLLAPVLAKPQLVPLVLPGLWLASWRRGGWRGALALPGAAALGSALLTLPLWIGYPNWIPDFLEGFRRNPPWQQPTIFGLLKIWWGPGWAAWLVPGLLALGLLALNMWLWHRYPPQEVLPWSLALTTLASPYIWTWDFVLFLPLLYRCLMRQRSRPAKVLWAVGLLLCWGLTRGLIAWVPPVEGEISHHWYFWMPWLFLALVGGGQALKRRTAAS